MTPSQARDLAYFHFGVRSSVSWLRHWAEKMEDPNAREILNNAAFNMRDAKAGVQPPESEQ